MHEFGIASDVLDKVAEIAAQNALRRVIEIEVRCGVARQVVPEALLQAFEAVAGGTVAAGATLRVVEEPLQVRCRPCDFEFGANIEDYRCPQCGQADVRLVGGNDIILSSVTGESENNGAK